MATQEYLDFDLRLERVDGGFRAVVLNSPAGEGAHSFALPFSPDKLEVYLLQIGQRRTGMRRAESPGTQAAREFGGRLFEAVFDGEVRDRWYGSLTEAQQRDCGLRLRLRLTEAPELADIPWEYLYDPRDREFLLLSAGTPLVHYLELPERIKPLAVQPPLRALVMIAAPADRDELEVEKEWRQLKEAAAPLEKQGLLAIDRLEQATLPALQAKLRKGEYHIFHFVGHGGFDTSEGPGEGVLIFEDENRRSRRVTGRDLAIYLRDEDTLRLVILNCCEGARTSRSDLFAGVAQTLVRRGIPAVIAMQFEVSDTAALCFAAEFYRALADDWPVDAALAEARKAIYGTGNMVEWGTPTLHLRAPDGRVFNLAKPAQSPVAVRLAALLADAANAAERGDWEGAVGKYEGILALEPGHSLAVEKLSAARSERALLNDYSEGRAHLDAGRWEQAVTTFQAVARQRPGYRDVNALLEKSKTRWRENLVGPPQDPNSGKPWVEPAPRPVPEPIEVRRADPVNRGWMAWLGIAIVGIAGLIAWGVASGRFNSSTDTPEPRDTETRKVPGPQVRATNAPPPEIPPAKPFEGWRVIAGGNQHEVPDTDLATWIRERRVDAGTMVQKAPGGSWTRLGEVPELAALLPPKPSPPPVSPAEEFSKHERESVKVTPSKQTTPPAEAAEDRGQPAGLRFLPAVLPDGVGYWQVDGWEQDPGEPRKTISGKLTFNFIGTFAMLFKLDQQRRQGEGQWGYLPGNSKLQLRYPDVFGNITSLPMNVRARDDGSFLLDGVDPQGGTTHLVIRRTTMAEVAREIQDAAREAFGVP